MSGVSPVPIPLSQVLAYIAHRPAVLKFGHVSEFEPAQLKAFGNGTHPPCQVHMISRWRVGHEMMALGSPTCARLLYVHDLSALAGTTLFSVPMITRQLIGAQWCASE